MKTLAAPYPGLRNLFVVYLMSCTQRVSAFCRMIHASSTWPLHFCHDSSWTFFKAVHQPDDAHKSTFLKICNHSWSFRTSVLEDVTFQSLKWCKFLGGKPCRSIETFYHWDSCLWDFRFSMHFTLSVAWKNSEKDSAVSFLQVYRHRDGNCNCLLQNTARWFPIAKCLQVLCPHCFVHDSWPRRFFHIFRFWLPKFLFRKSCSILLNTIVFNLW